MKLRGMPRAKWDDALVERFKASWRLHQVQIARLVARDLRLTEAAAVRAYYRFIVGGAEPSPLRRSQSGKGRPGYPRPNSAGNGRTAAP